MAMERISPDSGWVKYERLARIILGYIDIQPDKKCGLEELFDMATKALKHDPEGAFEFVKITTWIMDDSGLTELTPKQERQINPNPLARKRIDLFLAGEIGL